MVWWLVLISACFCRRPIWTPKTWTNGSSAVVWLSFWYSTQYTWKKCLSQRGEKSRLYSYILEYVVFGQPLLHLTVFCVWRVNFFLGNRVEHKKVEQTTIELPFNRVFGAQLGFWHTVEFMLNSPHLLSPPFFTQNWLRLQLSINAFSYKMNHKMSWRSKPTALLFYPEKCFRDGGDLAWIQRYQSNDYKLIARSLSSQSFSHKGL